MPLYKRKDSKFWWIKINHDGRTIYESTGTDDKQQAQEYHDQLKAQLWKQSKLGEKPKYRWEDAVLKWIAETKHKATQHDDIAHLRWCDIYLRNKLLENISREDIELITTQRLAQGASNATTNRTLAVRQINTQKVSHRLGVD